jgi:DNA-binding transcriptional LysR family regulator
MVVTMAAQGLGLAVVPASVANAPPADGAPVIVPIASPQVRSRLELAWPEAPSGNPAARVLIEQARGLRLPS